MQIYEPAEDSFLLALCIKKIALRITKKNPNASFLDMGTGSAIQAETALNSGFSKDNILTSDISRNAVINARKKGFESIQSNLFSKINRKFDIIAFNPPYLPYDKYDSNADTSGGKKGYETAVRFISQVKSHLKEKGVALLLISSLTYSEVIEKEIKKHDLKFKKISLQKLFFEELFVLEIKR